MLPRGFTTCEIKPDGTRHIRWFPETPAAKAERMESARDAAARELAVSKSGKIMLGKKLHAAVMKAGAPYKFDKYHWQIRRDGRVLLDFWTKAGGRASWRWANTGMRKGMMVDLIAALEARSIEAQRGEDE